jgi:hypothetical protein
MTKARSIVLLVLTPTSYECQVDMYMKAGA